MHVASLAAFVDAGCLSIVYPTHCPRFTTIRQFNTATLFPQQQIFSPLVGIITMSSSLTESTTNSAVYRSFLVVVSFTRLTAMHGMELFQLGPSDI